MSMTILLNHPHSSLNMTPNGSNVRETTDQFQQYNISRVEKIQKVDMINMSSSD